MRLVFTDEKLTVSQAENSADFNWEEMGRLDAKPAMYILYMDRVHAYLIPKTALAEQEEAFRELVTAHLPKERRRKNLMEYKSNSPEETFALGKQLGATG